MILQGEPGKDGLDGLPGVDGAKVTSDFQQQIFFIPVFNILHNIYTLSSLVHF